MVRTIVLSVDPGIELGLTVFVTSRRYRETNSAQALKETNGFTRLNADPYSYARVSRRDDYVSFDTTSDGLCEVQIITHTRGVG